MKNYFSVAVVLLALHSMAIGETPSLSLYEYILPDPENRSESGELLLKLNNPTDKPLYLFGLFLADISCSTEVVKNGKWVSYPSPPHDRVNPTFRKLLPHSYILFQVYDFPSEDEDLVFRIRTRVFTRPIWTKADEDVGGAAVMDLISPELSTKKLRAQKPKASANIPSLEPIPKAK